MRKNYLFKNNLLSFLLTLFSVFIFAQIPPIMVCNPAGNSCAPYTTLDDAFTNANPGDYIYLPGGTFTITKTIDKEIHIYGAGFDANGTPATGVTSISGDFNMVDGSNNSSFEGFYLNGNFGNSYNNASEPNPYESKNITVKSCNINAFNGKFSFSKVINCISRSGSYFYMGKNNEILNSIFYNLLRGLENTLINHNVFVSGIEGDNYGHLLSLGDVNNSVIKNNISIYNFYFGSYWYTFNNNSLINNIAGGYAWFNILNINDYFTTGNYSYGTSDWHMKPDGAGHNAGDDGTDIGIYGGSTPWKEGGVPSNPHIFFKSIGNTTDGSGNLPVQIKVSAQN